MPSGSSVWRRYVALALAAVPAYFLLPHAAQNLALLATNLVSLAAVLYAWRRRRLRPTGGWLLLAAFPALTAIGNAVYFVNDSILGTAPFPSYGDGAFLGGYLLLALGLLRLQQARSAGRDLPAVLDTAIITIGFGVASWVLLIGSLVREQDVSLLARLTVLGYPVADVLVLAVAARFLLTSRRRGPAFTWLAGTVLLMLVADTSFAVLNLLELYETGHPTDALIVAYNLAWGAVALHPQAADLSGAPQAPPQRPSRLRLTALVVASLVAPVALVLLVVTGREDDVLVTAGASAVLFLLVVVRMAGLVRTLERVLQQRAELERELAHRAHHDELTGLANRRTFGGRVQAAVADRPGGGVRLLYLDLDRFKTVNDSLGHAAGDVLLVTCAERLRAALRPRDTAARLGGDEFAVLLADDERDLAQVQEALSATLRRPVSLQGLDVQVSASIGAATTGPGETVESLLHRADVAMYAQKTRTDRRAGVVSTPETERAAPPA